MTLELNSELAISLKLKILAIILVSESMPAYDDGLIPSIDQSGNIINDYRLSKYGAFDDISDGPVRRLPHLL